MRFRLFWVIMAVVAVAVLTGVVVGWLGSKETESKAEKSPNPPKGPAASATPQLPQFESSTGALAAAPAPPVAIPTQPPPASTSTNVIADWEDKLDQILQAEGPENE